MEIEGLGDDTLEIIICNRNLGTPTSVWWESGSWTYSGPCDDIFFRVENNGGGLTGLMIVLREVGGTWLTSRANNTGPTDLNLTVSHDPRDFSFFTDPNFDYVAHDWIDVVYERILTVQVPWAIFASTRGYPDAVSYVDGGTGGRQPTWYRAVLPYC